MYLLHVYVHVYIVYIHVYIYTVEPLYCGQHWDKYKCPDYRGVLISGVNLYYKVQFGTSVSVLNTGVSSIEGIHCICIIIIHL